MRAIPEMADGAAGGVGGCGPCAGADAAANSWKARKTVAALNIFDLMALSHSTQQMSVCRTGFSRIGAALRPRGAGADVLNRISSRYLANSHANLAQFDDA